STRRNPQLISVDRSLVFFLLRNFATRAFSSGCVMRQTKLGSAPQKWDKSLSLTFSRVGSLDLFVYCFRRGGTPYKSSIDCLPRSSLVAFAAQVARLPSVLARPAGLPGLLRLPFLSVAARR